MPLPPGFEWDEFDINDDAVVEEICEYLMANYVEDQVGNFRLHYTKEKFRWACASPGYIKEWHFLIRSSKNKKILATCVGCPRKIVVHGQHFKICEGNFLSVHYSLQLVDGSEIDSSFTRGAPIEFTCGVGQVIKGWDEAMQLLNKGSKARLVIPSDLGYGSVGAGNGVIPPNATLIFDVELVDIK